MIDDRKINDAVLREHLYYFVWRSFGTLHPGQAFVPAWHVETMCWHLQQVAEGRIRRLLITVPPRHLKSICTSVAFVGWLLGRDPGMKVHVASYGQDLAAQHARDFRTLIEAPWYRRLFPGMQIHPRRNTELELLTTRQGGRKAVSPGGSVTGFGAEMIVIDDLMKAVDARLESSRQAVKDFYEQTLFSRLNDKRTGRIVAIQQRLHEDDFPAYLIDKGNFEHLNLKAIAEEDEEFRVNFGRLRRRRRGEALFPEREPLEVLEQIREEMGAFRFSAQYQQNPTPPEGNRVRWDWLGTYAERPLREELQMVVQSWDTAVTAEPTSDFSVCTTWGFREGTWYLLDVFRDRLEYPALRRRILKLRDRWRADPVIIEYANTGIPLVREFRNEGLGRLEAYHPRIDKETRLEAQTAKLERGNFLIPEEADWLPAFKHELLAFPGGRYDDQVDSMAQFLDWTGMRRGLCDQERARHGGRRPGGQRPFRGRRRY
jgi:predicted phage terminase large subunit-like protein